MLLGHQLISSIHQILCGYSFIRFLRLFEAVEVAARDHGITNARLA